MLPHFCRETRLRKSFHGTLPRTAGNREPRIGRRFLSERRQYHDVQRDLAPALRRPVFINFEFSAQPFRIAVACAAGIERNASLSFRLERRLGGGRAGPAQLEWNRVAALLPCSGDLASVVTELSFINRADTFQLEA